MPAFHVLMVVRDEADILPQTLPPILRWADTFHVFDTGSTDGTWEHLQAVAGADSRVVCVERRRIFYSISIMAWLFDRVRHKFRDGDWIVRADADEFHAAAPPDFVRENLRPVEGRVYGAHYDFQFTHKEWAAWAAGAETIADRARPIQDRRRFFAANEHKELRLFRYRRSMRWLPGKYEPKHAGLAARARIPIQHYAKRDPPQMRQRFALRCATRESGQPVGRHWAYEDWRRTIAHDPEMTYWPPGTSLPQVPRAGFAGGGVLRLLQSAYYATGAVRLADLFRPGFPAEYTPPPIPDEVEARIATLSGWQPPRPPALAR